MSSILHSIYGRKLGLDANGYISVGESKGITVPALKMGASGSEISMYGSTAVVTATSATTATDLLAAGVSIITTGDFAWRMDAPVIGLIKHIVRLSSDTTTTGSITLESGGILTSAGSTPNVINMTGNSLVSLIGVSTSRFGVVSRFPTTSLVAIA